MADFVAQAELFGSTLVLVDTDAERLALMAALARQLIDAGGAEYGLEVTTDRQAALPGADVVIVSVEIERFPTWEEDRRIPASLGVDQALGENGGPGGLMHALRQIPPIVEICQDVARLCPTALVLNLSNPMSRICQAVADYTDVRCVGLCHEIAGGNRMLSRLLDLPPEDLEVVAAGINHFTWYLDIRHRHTGQDLYPRVRAAAPRAVTHTRLLTAELLRLTGLLCVTSDSHVGEYLAGGHVWRTAWASDMEPLDFFAWYQRYVADIHQNAMAVVEGRQPPSVFLGRRSGEIVTELIADVVGRRLASYDALNLLNGGLIGNLPPDAIVEVPGAAVDGRVRGIAVGDLPPLIQAWAYPQTVMHRLTAVAAMEGDRRAALEVLLIDPTVPGVQMAERLLDALLAANRRHLPRFFS
jgi:alpha-galactosidase